MVKYSIPVIAGDGIGPEVIEEGSAPYRTFAKLKNANLGLISGRYVQHTLQQDLPTLWKTASKLIYSAFPMKLPDRVRNNITVTTLGILSVCEFVSCSVPDIKSVMERVLGNVIDVKSGRTTLVADDLVSDVVHAVALGQGAQYFHHS